MLFEPGELQGKEFKVKTVHNEAGEQAALYYACQSAAFGAFLWNMLISRSYANKAEIDQGLEREMMRLANQRKVDTKEAAMKSMITRAGLFVPNAGYTPGHSEPEASEE